MPEAADGRQVGVGETACSSCCSSIGGGGSIFEQLKGSEDEGDEGDGKRRLRKFGR